jgi:predicted nucleic acid-binding Zn ribbon protein
LSDLVKRTFDQLRQTAKRRGPVPDLRNQGKNVVPRRSRGVAATVPGLNLEPERRRKYNPRGIPTGPDGRALPRSYKVDSFSSLLGTEIRKRDWTEHMAYGWVMGNWSELVGEKIAQHTKVEMIKEGEVFITCDTTAWATQLKYMQSTVLKSIAAKVGPDVVTKLHIFGPKTKSWRYGPLHVKGRGPRDTYG